MGELFSILAVCTGNICRSPAMERLLAHMFAEEDSVIVRSAGTFAHSGWDMQPGTRQRLEWAGAATDGFVAEQTTPQMLRGADLILGATREHVRDMLADAPEAAPRTFTVRHFGRITAHIQDDELPSAGAADRLKALVALADARRDRTGPLGEESDVVDPYMLPEDVYDQAFDEICEPLGRLAEKLGMPAPPCA
ncbi:low molecular weight phosphatase family protein [Nesterenkonia sp. NBAIMH1]|uniref:arsenate reductase/protein-tyrosine-phosphatase family protein n=1 Tax=Nesterenkonia sp. NBAIMH1 TaxID=2600320 RepID=UPI0011B66A8C|nr:low molecular weight phosphatase family protein [Nesterenkonia sp. NBAIMH1]